VTSIRAAILAAAEMVRCCGIGPNFVFVSPSTDAQLKYYLHGMQESGNYRLRLSRDEIFNHEMRRHSRGKRSLLPTFEECEARARKLEQAGP